MGQICSFCGSHEEPKKVAAFADTSSSDVHDSHDSRTLSRCQQTPNQSPALDFNNHTSHASSHGHTHVLDPESSQVELDQIEEERQRRMAQYRLEQVELARREAIVTTASQSMVPVGSQASVVMGGHRMMNHHNSHQRLGGINTYYDPAYAATAAQDILRIAAITGGLVFCDDRATRAAWNLSMVGTMPVSITQVRGSLANPKDVIESLGRGRWDGVRLGSRGSGLAGCGGEDPEYYLDDLAEEFLEKVVPTKTSLFGGCASIVENLP